MTELVHPRPIAPAVLGGQLLAASETPATTEDLARAWLLSYADRENTTRSYHRGIVEWFAFCADAGVDPLAARRPLVELYKTALGDRGRAPATVAQRLSAVASFYAYCEDEEAVRRSPARGVRRPKLTDQTASTGLTRGELTAFLTAAAARGPQVHALMTLLSLNGLRASEPLNCAVTDLGHERGHRTLAVDRKGSAGKVRVPLAPRTAAALEPWLDVRAQQLPADSGALFYKVHRHTGRIEQLGRRDVHRWVRSLGHAAVPHKPALHPHDLRHAFVTLALDAGVPLRDVQDSAGHASPLTTRRYDRDRGRIDRHATYTLASYLGGAD
ncbi:tyrosine-type recombinase/integrase [Blastococcus sp. SYSU DS0617]